MTLVDTDLEDSCTKNLRHKYITYMANQTNFRNCSAEQEKEEPSPLEPANIRCYNQSSYDLYVKTWKKWIEGGLLPLTGNHI